MVHLQELHERYKDKGLVILGFNSSDKKHLAEALLRKKGVTFPCILDCSEAASRAAYRGYGLSGVPLNYVIDKQGKVVDAWYGYRKNDPRLKKALQKLGIDED
jgi:peroxiredoxin